MSKTLNLLRKKGKVQNFVRCRFLQFFFQNWHLHWFYLTKNYYFPNFFIKDFLEFKSDEKGQNYFKLFWRKFIRIDELVFKSVGTSCSTSFSRWIFNRLTDYNKLSWSSKIPILDYAKAGVDDLFDMQTKGSETLAKQIFSIYKADS